MMSLIYVVRWKKKNKDSSRDDSEGDARWGLHPPLTWQVVMHYNNKSSCLPACLLPLGLSIVISPRSQFWGVRKCGLLQAWAHQSCVYYPNLCELASQTSSTKSRASGLVKAPGGREGKQALLYICVEWGVGPGMWGWQQGGWRVQRRGAVTRPFLQLWPEHLHWHAALNWPQWLSNYAGKWNDCYVLVFAPLIHFLLFPNHSAVAVAQFEHFGLYLYVYNCSFASVLCAASLTLWDFKNSFTCVCNCLWYTEKSQHMVSFFSGYSRAMKGEVNDWNCVKSHAEWLNPRFSTAAGNRRLLECSLHTVREGLPLWSWEGEEAPQWDASYRAVLKALWWCQLCQGRRRVDNNLNHQRFETWMIYYLNQYNSNRDNNQPTNQPAMSNLRWQTGKLNLQLVRSTFSFSPSHINGLNPNLLIVLGPCGEVSITKSYFVTQCIHTVHKRQEDIKRNS